MFYAHCSRRPTDCNVEIIMKVRKIASNDLKIRVIRGRGHLKGTAQNYWNS